MPSDFPTRISFAEALRILDEVASSTRLEIERVPLARGLGRVLASDVASAIDLPSFDNAAMDGFALRAEDLREAVTPLQLVGEQFAGPSLGLAIAAGQCLRITTGAPMPEGADTVVMKEDTRIDGTRVEIGKQVATGTHVRRAGEDVRIGDVVLHAGQALSPAALALAAAIGVPELECRRRPTVAVFTTATSFAHRAGVAAGGNPRQQSRVAANAARRGWLPARRVASPARRPGADRRGAGRCRVLLRRGHHLRRRFGWREGFPAALLAEQGKVHFWKVRMRPGMPVLAGRLGDAQLLCLPGNPVSVFATYLTMARRFLDGLQGRVEPRPRLVARLGSALAKGHDRLEFLRGSLTCDAQGQMWVVPNPADGSHRLRAVAESNALIVLPEELRGWEAGTLVEVLPLPRI
jgi:molybdopterin molybdotransferase